MKLKPAQRAAAEQMWNAAGALLEAWPQGRELATQVR
jgi:hypothetical protein